MDLFQMYRAELAALTINSKPIITSLTMIAGDNRNTNASAVAAALESHIMECPGAQRLPALYVLDSIVKNIGEPYVGIFAVRLPEVFATVFASADPRTQHNLQKLFGTWRGVFYDDVLARVQASVASTGWTLVGVGQPAVQQQQQMQQQQMQQQQMQQQQAYGVTPGAPAAAPVYGMYPQYQTQQPPPLQYVQAPQQPHFIGQPAMQHQPQQPIYGYQVTAGIPQPQHSQPLQAPPYMQHQQQQQPMMAPVMQQPQQPMMTPGMPPGNNDFVTGNILAQQGINAQALLEAVLDRPGTRGMLNSAAVSPTTTTAHAQASSFDASFLRERHEFVLDALYWDQNHQCGQTGRRFKTAQDLRTFTNARAMGKSGKAAKSELFSRRWWVDDTEWCGGGELPSPTIRGDGGFFGGEAASEAQAVEVSSSKAKGNAGAVASDGEPPSVAVGDLDAGGGVCALSGEKFELFWNDEDEEWRYKNCVELPDGRLVLASLVNSLTSPPTSPVRNEFHGPGPISSAEDAADAAEAAAAATRDQDEAAVDLSKLEAIPAPPDATTAAAEVSADVRTGKGRSVEDKEGATTRKRARRS